MDEPTILTANTFYWKPSSCAYSRRSNEKRRQKEAAGYFRHLGMEVKEPEGTDNVIGTLGSLRVVFHYRESCTSVYKSLSVTRDGKKSNITALRRLAESKAA